MVRSKKFIHSKSDVVKQLLFNLDVNTTLQQLIPVMEGTETLQTLEFVRGVKRSNMLNLGEKMYAVGKIKQVTLGPDKATALGVAREEPVNSFTRLYKDCMFYHSLAYARVNGERNNTICIYSRKNTPCFGQVLLFINHPQQSAIVKKMDISETFLMKQAGPPATRKLRPYHQDDLLGRYIKPISGFSGVTAVPVRNLLGIAVLLHGSDCDYVAIQPNTLERH